MVISFLGRIQLLVPFFLSSEVIFSDQMTLTGCVGLQNAV